MTSSLRFTAILFAAAALVAQDLNQAPDIDPNQPPSQDPPARVARLALLPGQVSFQPATVQDWTAATLNYPVTIGDHLFSDNDSRAELQIGSTALRLGSLSSMSFLNLDDRVVQIRLDEGALILRVRAVEPDDVYEIDTAQGAITILSPGEYRIDTDPDRNATMVTVRSGDATVNTNAGTFSVPVRQTAYFAADGNPQFASENPIDGFDQFSIDQDRATDEIPQPQYVSQDMPGWQDLERNGQWVEDREYGPVWRPRAVVADWAPYRYGHWAWVEPWGWTWIDDASWGFAPFHYGRWVMVGAGWGWAPGPRTPRPVYAPALVAFVGGGGISAVAWFPLGPREVFVPSYRVSPAYVNRVNVTRVNVTNITVVNRTYVNRSFVTAVDRQVFVGARPVHRAMVSVPHEVVLRSRVSVAAPVAPERMSVLGRASAPGNVPRPNSRITDRQVYAQRTPPPAPVPFAARQRALEANPGRPVDRRTMDQLRNTAAPVRQPAVRTLPQNNSQPRQFGRSSPSTNDRPSFDRSTRQPAATPEQQQQPSRRNRPEFNNTNQTPAPTPAPTRPIEQPQQQQPQPERRQRNRPEIMTPAPAPTRPIEQPQQQQPQPERRQRNRPEPSTTTPAPTPAPAPTPTPRTERPAREERQRPERPERPAVQSRPAPPEQRPAVREEKPAPRREERQAPKRENRKDENKKEEK
jgi:hypothetical protein